MAASKVHFLVGHDEDQFMNYATPHSWPVTLSPEMSSDIYMIACDQGMESLDASNTEPWNHPPVSYISSTHPLGPRNFAPNYYACPYPGCTEPFGAYDHADGYLGRSLTQHIYRRHGYGPAVDLVSLSLRRRVINLRLEQGKKDLGENRLPRLWRDPGRDLARASIDITQDLEEISAWERSGRLEMWKKESYVFPRPVEAQGTDIPDVSPYLQRTRPDNVEHQPRQRPVSPLPILDHKGKGKAVVSRDQHMSSSPEDLFERERTATPPPSPPRSIHTPPSRHRANQAVLLKENFLRSSQSPSSPSLRCVKKLLSSPMMAAYIVPQGAEI